jgi:tRNA(Ile)-lysidine synthase
MSAFIKNIQNTAHANNLWSRGSKILVGVSGGPDSVCLLDVLFFLSKKYAWQLHIAHINYGLRGDDSDGDEAFVKDLAQQYKIPCSILKPNITQSANLEEALRDIRYAFFEKTRQEHAFDSVAVAHTLDDQAETVLMRLIRGSGLSGLRAMRPKSGVIIRPLLETTRKDIEHYLKKGGLIYRTDTSNTDTRFFRNNVRHKLIPYLQEHFNRSIKEVLANTARIVGEDYDKLLSFTEVCPIPFHHHAQMITFQASNVLALHPSTQKMVLRNFFSLVRGNLKSITNAHMDELFKMLHSIKSKSQTISFGGLTVERKGNVISITHASPTTPTKPLKKYA